MIDLTAKIVAAYVSRNALQTDELSDFIKSVYGALSASAAPEAATPLPAAPAISIKKSVTPGAIFCLECGKPQKMLKRHLMTAHGLSVDAYKSKWALPASYPMVSPEYASTRSALAKAAGLGQSRQKAAAAAAVSEKPKRGRPAKAAAK